MSYRTYKIMFWVLTTCATVGTILTVISSFHEPITNTTMLVLPVLMWGMVYSLKRDDTFWEQEEESK